MKRILLSSVALFGLTATALAADLPRRTVVAPAPFVAVPVFTWTGFYVGVNAGYGWEDRDDRGGFTDLTIPNLNGVQVPIASIPHLSTSNRQGFLGGAQIGANYQFTPGSGLVIGIEADIQGTTFGRRRGDGSGAFAGSGLGGGGLGGGGLGGGGLGGAGFNVTGSGPIVGTVNVPNFGTPICFNPGNGDTAPLRPQGGGVFACLPGAGTPQLGFLAPGGIGGTTPVPVTGTAAFTGPGFLPGTGVAATGFGAPNVVLFTNPNAAGGREKRSLDWFATVRGRLGWAFDRLLVYGTGGIAFADRDRNHDCFSCFNTASVPANFFVNAAAAQAGTAVIAQAQAFPFGFDRRRNDDFGVVFGGGVEYAFTDNISAKVEGLWLSFRDGNRNHGFFNQVVGVTNTGAPITATTFSSRDNSDDIGVIRAGVNFKFTTF